MSCFAFDLDGVLIIAPLFTENLYQKFKVPAELSQSFIEGEYQDCVVGKKDLKEILPRYIKEWQLKISVQELLDFWFAAENKPNQELLDFIQKLRSQGHYCCILTNQEKYRMEYIRQTMGYVKYFDSIISSCEIGFKKPSQEYFLTSAKLIGYDLDKINFFDDREKYVKESINAGLNGFIFKNNYQCKNKIESILNAENNLSS